MRRLWAIFISFVLLLSSSLIVGNLEGKNIQYELLAGPVHNIDTDEYFNEIQTAIDDPDTLNGHTIEVANGTYYENVVVDKSLTLIGEDMNTTIIDGSDFGDVVTVTANWVNITCFTVQNAGPNEFNRDASIKLTGADYCHIYGNHVIDNEWLAIHLESGAIFNLIEHNNCSFNRYGIYIETDWNTISNNTFFNNSRGILLWGHNNDILHNYIYWNGFGFLFSAGANNNQIVENEINDNYYGIYIDASGSSNYIYHNNFVLNNVSAVDEGGGNFWDDGYPSGGNYWDDYTGVDFNSTASQNVPPPDGIGDTPYYFDFDQDDYPLMMPYPNTAPWIDLTSPDGGEIWAGGSSKDIVWNMGDNQDIMDLLTVDLYYSTNSGSTFPNTIAMGLSGYLSNPCTYAWNPVPSLDLSTIRVRAVVTDTGALTDQDDSQADFTIDSTAPAPATNVRAELTGTHVTIYWDGSVSLDVDHYEIYYTLNNWDPTGDSYNFLADTGLTCSYQHNNAGVNNPSSYYWQLRTYDYAGHETRTIIQAGKHGSMQSTFANPTGWFLCGYSLVQSNTSVEHVIQGAGLPANVGRIMLYRDGVWLQWAPYWPPSLNTLKDIYLGEVFWMNVISNTRWATAGYLTDMSIVLEAGWNFVAYPFAERTMTTAAIMAHLSANCPSYVSPIYIMDPSAPYLFSPATGTEILGHGSAFLVMVGSDSTWTVMNY